MTSVQSTPGVELTPHRAERLSKKIIREVNGFRAESFSELPFWAIQAARLELIVVHDGVFRGNPLPTAMTDGRKLVINSKYWESLMPNERKTLFMHELGHVALGHPFRRGTRDFKKFNIAGDHEINLILEEMRLTIPGRWLCDSQFKGMAAERIFTLIPDEVGPRRGKKEEEGPIDEPCERDEEEPSEEGESEEEDGEDGEGEGESEETSPPEDPSDDSGEGEPPPPGEFWDPTGPDGEELTEEEKSEEFDELKKDLVMAELANKARGKGNSPSMQRSVDRLLRPKMDWRNHIDRWIREKGKPVGRTWSRLDRRSMQIGIFQPGEIKDGIQNMRVYVDVSSSISFPEYRAFMSHLDLIRNSVEIESLSIIPFNETIVQSDIVELKAKDETPKNLNVCGGTAFSPIFNWERRQSKAADGIIIFTDLCCDDYGTPTDTPILWVSTDEIFEGYDGWGGNTPPFGDVVQIDISDD